MRGTIIACTALFMTPGCSEPEAHIIAIGDRSQTVALIRSEEARGEFVDAIMTAATDKTRFMNGDSVHIVAAGNRSVKNVLSSRSIETGPRRRIAFIRPKVEEYVDDLFSVDQTSDGDMETHLIAAIESAVPDCTRGGLILIYSDGVDEGVPGLLDSLKRAEAITIPQPQTAYLSGCSVQFFALGETAQNPFTGEDRRLSDAQYAILEDAFRQYFIAAGIKPEDIHFA